MRIVINCTDRNAYHRIIAGLAQATAPVGASQPDGKNVLDEILSEFDQWGFDEACTAQLSNAEKLQRIRREIREACMGWNDAKEGKELQEHGPYPSQPDAPAEAGPEGLESPDPDVMCYCGREPCVCHRQPAPDAQAKKNDGHGPQETYPIKCGRCAYLGMDGKTCNNPIFNICPAQASPGPVGKVLDVPPCFCGHQFTSWDDIKTHQCDMTRPRKQPAASEPTSDGDA
jgi:hypothetical protein